MRKLIAVLAILAACGGGGGNEKQYPGSAATPDSSHVVATKIAPDTLVDQNGKFCVVRPSAKFEAADSGAVYDNCAWSDTARAQKTASRFRHHFSIVSVAEAQSTTVATGDSGQRAYHWPLILGLVVVIVIGVFTFRWYGRRHDTE